MIVRSYTNNQQSERMIQLGFNPETADFWKTSQVGGYRISTEREVNSKPVWSLGFILGIMRYLQEKVPRVYSIEIKLETGYIYLANGNSKDKEFISEDFINNLLDCLEYLSVRYKILLNKWN